MATYPSFPQLVGTAVTHEDGRVMRRSMNGAPRIKTFYSNTKYGFTVKHEIDSADLATLNSFWNTNRNLAFDFVYEGDGLTYSCYFLGRPHPKPIGGDYYEVTSNIVVA